MFDTLLPWVFSGATTPEERVACFLLFTFFLELIASLISSVLGMTNSRRGR